MNEFGTYLPRGKFRCRALLDLAHKIERCQNCGFVRAEGMDPAHSNLPEHGRGAWEKSHDCFFAALCSACHRWLDNQGGFGKDPTGVFEGTREGKREMFVKAMHATWLELWRLLLVRVA